MGRKISSRLEGAIPDPVLAYRKEAISEAMHKGAGMTGKSMLLSFCRLAYMIAREMPSSVRYLKMERMQAKSILRNLPISPSGVRTHPG